MIKVPQFNTKKELFNWLVANKRLLIDQKKFATKLADPFSYSPIIVAGAVNKAAVDDNSNQDLQIKSVINTTNWLDSHGDVHIPGIWNKSLSERNNFYLLQEHSMTFEKIISDEVKASAANYSFRELGVDIDGITQALVFDSVIMPSRNKFMYGQYAKGYVRNHSVGMRYMKIVMCIDDEDYGAEYEAWQKYQPQVANKAACDEVGYFWAVTEAKIIEGSAVPLGSNSVTPTLLINSKAANEALDNNEPPEGTQQQQQQNSINWDAIASKFFSN